MTFFDSSKSILENLYLLSGPLLFIIGLIGIRQLKIAKDNIRINSQRQASTMSFELCEKYEKSIETKYSKLYNKLKVLNIEPDKLLELNPSSVRNLKGNIINNIEFKKILENRDEISYLIVDLANELEGFSVPFIKKLADEELAYDLTFNQYYHWAILSMSEIHYAQKVTPNLIEMDYYGNICDLYELWKSRNEKEVLERQVATLINKKNKITTNTIKPIGTE